MSKPPGKPKTGEIEVLYASAEIAHRVAELATEIAREMGPEILIVAILKGGFVFAADLVRALHLAGVRPQIDFMMLASYGKSKESSGEVRVLRDVTDDVAGREILVIDDILDSGRTLAFAKQSLLDRGAGSVRLCILLDKRDRRAAAVDAEFVGFACPDRFVVGYGLDFANYHRELPYIGALPEDEAQDDAKGET